LNDNQITTVGTGLAGVLAVMTLVQVFILPEYLRRPFTTSTWSFSFPLAATANTVCRWAVAAPQPVGRVLAWPTPIFATAIVGLLASLTAWRARFKSGVIGARSLCRRKQLKHFASSEQHRTLFAQLGGRLE
jgi:tellurite resistance protein